jgi:hypothetical protein
MKNIILLSFGLCFFASCIKLDYQTLVDKTFQKFDKNRNHVFEENEFRPILVKMYRLEKFSKTLENNKIKLNEYLQSEFYAYDSNKNNNISIEEIFEYDSFKAFKLKDLNKNGFWEVENEFQFLLTQKAYNNEIKLNQSIIKNKLNDNISYNEYLQRINEELNPNKDKKIEYSEYLNFLKKYCLCAPQI